MSSIRISFPHNEEVWNLVVRDGREDGIVEEQDGERFVMEYASEADANSVISRLEGMVDYQRLP